MSGRWRRSTREGNVQRLFQVLSDWLLFFFKGNRYHIVHSSACQPCGGASIELASDRLRWLLIIERGEISLLCRPASGGTSGNAWVSMDIIHTLLTSEVDDLSSLTAEMAHRIELTVDDIEAVTWAAADDGDSEASPAVGQNSVRSSGGRDSWAF